MRQGEGEAISTVEQAIDLISVVKEIHGLNSQELNKLLRDSENFTIHFVTEKGLDVKDFFLCTLLQCLCHLIEMKLCSDIYYVASGFCIPCVN